MKPYWTWTLFDASVGHKLNGGYCPFAWTFNKPSDIPDYWRTTLRDLAEYQGGP